MRNLNKKIPFTNRKLSKKLAIVVVISTLVIAVLLIVFDITSRVNYAKYDQEADRIIAQVYNARDVIKVQKPGNNEEKAASYKRGDGLIDSWNHCTSQDECPVAIKSVLVLLPKDHENQFISSLLDITGYDHNRQGGCFPFDNITNFCLEQRSNEKYHIDLSVNAASLDSASASDQDKSSTNVWRNVTVTVTPSH
jgi:hypothetical protein